MSGKYRQSDHRPITFTIKNKAATIKTFRLATKFCKENKFKKHAKRVLSSYPEAFERVQDITTYDQVLDDFYKDLHRLCDSSFKRRGFSKKTNLHWWTEDLRIRRNKLKAMYTRYKKNPDQVHFKQQYAKEHATYKTEIRKSKLRAWRNYCSTTKDKFGSAFAIMKGTNGNSSNTHNMITPEMPVTTTSDELQTALVKHHFAVGNYEQEETALHANYIQINAPEIRNSLRNSNPNKARPWRRRH